MTDEKAIGSLPRIPDTCLGSADNGPEEEIQRVLLPALVPVGTGGIVVVETWRDGTRVLSFLLSSFLSLTKAEEQ